MKALLLVGLICSITLSSFCQEKNKEVIKDQQYYLQKSKKQFKSGLITLGVGLGLFALTATNGQTIDDIGTNIVLIGGGGVATITGAVLLLSSASNKSKAKSATVFARMEKLLITQSSITKRVYYPEVGIRLSLR